MSGNAARLYTPELLDLTVRLAHFPWDETLPLRGDARSPSCGSTLAVALSADRDGGIERLGLRVQACVVGQAAASIFAADARGRNVEDIRNELIAIRNWLHGEETVPAWPGLDLLSPARAFPGRHGAILLPWQAALTALCKPSVDR